VAVVAEVVIIQTLLAIAAAETAEQVFVVKF
jgi:hypothetical protein